MIIAGCQADNKTYAGPEPVQATNKVIKVDRAALHFESVPWHFGECQHSTLGRRGQAAVRQRDHGASIAAAQAEATASRCAASLQRPQDVCAPSRG